MAGRKRKPTEVLKAAGTFRAHRRPNPEPANVAGNPDISWSEDPDVEAWFELLRGYLQDEGRMSRTHEMILWLAARRAAEIKRLDWDIFTNGRTYWKPSAAGEHLKSNPAVGQRNEAERHLQSLLSELGLTPASKSKVSSTIKKDVHNDWSGFDDADEAPTRRN